MPTTVDELDELEALLAGLDDDELKASASSGAAEPDFDAELEAALAADEAAAVVKPEPVKRTRKLKPLVVEEEPKAPVPEEPSSALQGTRTETADTTLEALAEKVIDLLTTLGDERKDLTEEQIQEAATPVLDRIKATSSYVKIEAAIRKRIDAIEKPAEEILPQEPDSEDAELKELVIDDDVTDVEVEVTGSAMDRASRAAKDQVLEALANTPEPTPQAEITQEQLDKAILSAAGGDVEMAKTLGMVGDPTDDEELAALLASAPESTPVVPTPTPTTGAAAAVATRPTKTKAGALRTFIDADQLQKDLEFTTTNISLAMTRQAALFAHYSRLAADATYQSDRSKQQVELLEATLNQRFRDSLLASGTKFTEKSIDSMVIQDSSYQDAQERAHEARAIAKMVETAADSFRHRKDMLIQVGADLRLEKQGELRMKEHPGEAAKRAMSGE